MIMMWQCRFLSCNKCTHLGIVDNEGGCACVGVENTWEISVPSVQCGYEPKNALKNSHLCVYEYSHHLKVSFVILFTTRSIDTFTMKKYGKFFNQVTRLSIINTQTFYISEYDVGIAKILPKMFNLNWIIQK